MTALRVAAGGSDAALDWALLRVGILAPADLTEIREVLANSALLRAATNDDGHRIVEVVADGALVTQVHHDGRVVTSCLAVA